MTGVANPPQVTSKGYVWTRVQAIVLLPVHFKTTPRTSKTDED